MRNKLLVVSVKDRMVMDIAALDINVKRYVGYRFDGKDYVRTEELVSVDDNSYYRKAIRNGDLEQWFKEV